MRLSSSGREAGPLFIETSSYSERVEGLGVWQEIALPPTRRTGGWMPENFADAVPRASRVTSENVDEIGRAVEAAEAAGRPEVMIDGGAGSDSANSRRARRVPGGPPGRAEGQFA